VDDTPRFRVGRHHRDRTLYDGDTLIGCVDTGYGPLIINALNTPTHTGTPTREQLLTVIRNALTAAGATHIPEDWIADPVMNLLADTELDTEGDLREQLTARYEALRAEDTALLERTQTEAQAEIERLLARPCPHVVTGDEGTSFCCLAEAPQPKVLRESVTEHPDPDGEVSFLTISGLVHAPPGTKVAVVVVGDPTQPKALSAFEDDIVRSAAIRITDEMDDADRVRMTGLLMIIDRLTEDTATQTEITHACPPGDAACTPCCGRTPFELPRTDRLTLDPTLVTCREDTAPPVTEDPA
jgi:hypothetical protein